MFKRKSLTVLMAVAIIISVIIAPFFGAKGITPSLAESSAGAEKISEGFEFADGAHSVISSFSLPESVKGDFEVIIPDGVTEIKDNVFNGLSALKGVAFNDGLKIIGDLAFAKTSLMSIVIPKSVTKIGEHAFNGCTALAEVKFGEGRSEALSISSFAFADCRALSALRLPDNTSAGQYAFSGCTSLLWVYVGENCLFKSSSGSDDATAAFFPTNTAITIIFLSKTEYDKMLGWTEKTFATKHLSAATYIVKVNCYIGSSSEPAVYERLHGKSFNYVPDKTTGYWNIDTAYDSLPAQAAHYSSTVWYGERELKNAVSLADVNGLLARESEINLYCHETISVPVFPAEPTGWVYKKSISYDTSSISDVLKALGCEQEFKDEQLNAIDYTVTFADEKGNVSETAPEAINGNGIYSVALSLKPEYGSWSQDITSQVTVNVNTNGFTAVMIALLVIGVLAVLVTVSTAVIRKKVQTRNKKKQLSQKEIIEKFKAAGGETSLE